MYSLFCVKTAQVYVETYGLSNDMSNIHDNWVGHDLCGIIFGCHFFGDTLYKQENRSIQLSEISSKFNFAESFLSSYTNIIVMKPFVQVRSRSSRDTDL